MWAHLGTDDKPKNVANLAAVTGIDQDFLACCLKHAAAMGCIIETGHNESRAINLTRALTVLIMAGGYGCFSGPGSTGRLVLQDLGQVIGEVPAKGDHVERTVYDFHTEQPIKGMSTPPGNIFSF